ncbi:MAG: amino acid kinase family protein, partial [Kiritimatiellia bacterium]
MKVCKFGGTSLASASQIRKVCDIVLADPERRIVVVSAPGKRDPRDTKVTDLLIACAQKRLAGEDYEPVLAAVLRRFAALREELGLAVAVQEQIEQDLRTRMGMDLSHREHFLDTIKAAGEANTALVVTAALQQRGVAVRSVCPREAGLLLSSEYGNATILPESYT